MQQAFSTAHPANIRELWGALGSPEISIDLDLDLTPDVTPLDVPFLMHGFFPIDVEQSLSAHHGLHYDVAAAQREIPGVPRNDNVGYSDHRVYGEAGIEQMRAVKRALDPGWKLAPGVIFSP